MARARLETGGYCRRLWPSDATDDKGRPLSYRAQVWFSVDDALDDRDRELLGMARQESIAARELKRARAVLASLDTEDSW